MEARQNFARIVLAFAFASLLGACSGRRGERLASECISDSECGDGLCQEGQCVREGALYPALHRLEQKGFLAEEWGMTETNREAKFYKLTPAGRKQLASELARWRDYARVMTSALAASRQGA